MVDDEKKKNDVAEAKARLEQIEEDEIKDKDGEQELVDQEVWYMESLAAFIANKKGGGTRLVKQYCC